MELALALASLVLSLAACGVCTLMFLHREDMTDARAKLRALELETADLVDRLSVWQRRDAARQRRSVGGSADAELGGPVADQHSALQGGKQHLREVARSRGLMR